MSDNEDALETDEAESAGAGADTGGEKFKPPKDGSWVPVERLKAVGAKLKAAREELATVRQNAAAGPAKAPKTWSLGELNAEVAAGRLTQESANQVWEDQVVERASQKARSVVTSESLATRQMEELAEYQRHVPALEDPASPEFERVEKEYRLYLANGLPDSPATQLVAARAALGPLEALREAKAAKAKGGETYSEVPGGKGGSGRTPTSLDQLDPRRKAYYQRAIDNGAYSGWDAVKVELETAAKRRAAR